MTSSEDKIVQQLNEAHALEAALVQTLSAHIAMTPEGAYRNLLEQHLEETRSHAQRILHRLSGLGESQNPLQLAYGIAQTAVGQVIAASKFPLDLLRGSGGEEKLLKNAKDEAASEALEIATYDALEAMATAGGDEETASLAREHREDEERFLAALRRTIPQLARDVHAAEVEGEPSFDVGSTGAAQAASAASSGVQAAARAAVSEVQESVEDAADRVSRRARATARATEPAPRPAPSAPSPSSSPSSGASSSETDLPIEGYESLPAEQIVPKLRLLSQRNLVKVEEFERANRNRKGILDRIAKLRTSTDGQPVGPTR